MPLDLRPNCEFCDCDLPPEAENAMICSFECTFCAECVDQVLGNVCPNCGGGFEKRPIGPAIERRPGVCVATRPPSGKRVHAKYSRAEIEAFRDGLKHIPAKDR